jgi:diadenosine tetraphosphate (Ap4A) HIT family hydrolase|tara:strand:+ start:80 stop:487 length:408 start_codon:yes stop_codon:yes gene_type:complete
MQSKKPTYKKPFETIDRYEESTWVGNDKPIFENDYCAVFNDRYPVVEGHLLFIAKKNDPDTIAESYKLAYSWGEKWIKEGKMDGFNVGQNIGRAAGQSIFWPHIHFIPRKVDDYEGDAHNGIRLSIPSGDHNNYY